MIHINDLRILPDHIHMVVDIEIIDSELYKDVTLSEVVIDTDNTFSGTQYDHSSKYIYRHICPSGSKKERFIIDLSSLNFVPEHMNIEDIKDGRIDPAFFLKHMFFVYVKTSGSPDPSAPCYGNSNIVMQTVIDNKRIYNMLIGFTGELSDRCEIPKGFMDYILLFKAFEVNVSTGHYVNAIKFWRKLHKNSSGLKQIHKCSCHG